MKKIIALFTILSYLFTSSTLVHSFCAKAHLDASLSAHSCCDDEDEGSQDCFDNCLSSFGDTISPVYKFIKNSSHKVDFGLESNIFEDTLHSHIPKYFLTEIVYDPPWQWNYVGITKKIE